MLSYTVRMIGKNHHIPVYEFEDDRLKPLTSFMLSEVRNFQPQIVEILSMVMSGKSQYETFSGNIFSLDITPALCTLTDHFSENECTVPTDEMYELVRNDPSKL